MCFVMEKERLKDKQLSYCDKLCPTARCRYKEKLADVKGIDPYEITKKQWSTNFDLLPPISHGDILNYVVFGVSKYTLQEFKAYKSLEAYMQFVDGWVQDLLCFQPSDCNNTVVFSKVMHSQRLNEKFLKSWVIADAEGCVLSAHCDCMAGIGETCTHVGAILFKIEATVRCREKTTVTGVPAYWMIPSSIDKVEPEVGYRINYAPSSAKKKALDRALDGCEGHQVPAQSLRTGCASRTTFPPATDEQRQSLLRDLHLTGDRAAVLQITPEYCADFIDNTPVVTAPKTLLTLRNPKYDQKDYDEILQYCKQLNSKVAVSEEQAAKLNILTRDQAQSKYWFAARAGRITASTMHSVLVTDHSSPARSTVQKVCYPAQVQLKVPAVEWGKTQESVALRRYEADINTDHFGLKVERCGLLVNPDFPHIGASPDSIVTCECCGKGCVEVKCPFKHRDNSIHEAASDKDFFLEKDVSGYSVKKNHRYYTQVQCQIFVSGADFCDVVVFTNIDFKVVRVLPDHDMWQKCLPKVANFFNKVVLPELVAKHFTRSATKPKRSLSLSPQNISKKVQRERRWCTCRRVESVDDMVACDNPNCAIEWFHFSCVGLTSAPGKNECWFCSTCRP